MMIEKHRHRIAIIGGGLGGCAVGALLQRAGFDAVIYEQAPVFARVGAGIHLSPNLMKVLREIGVEQDLLDSGDRPDAFVNRVWDSGELFFALPLGDAAETLYGAPYVTVRRGDLHAALMSSLAPGSVFFGKRLVGLQHLERVTRMIFEDGSSAEADAVVGADGLRSKTREILYGFERPRFSGQVAFRTAFPRSRLRGLAVEDLTKWWAPDKFVLAYFLDTAQEVFYFAAMTPQAEWPHEASSVNADLAEMLEIFAGFEPQVQRILRTAPDATKWALFERPATFVWGNGRVVLMGDACHPMRPHMAQGAAMALEDAAVLTRCLQHEESRDFEQAFQIYAAHRAERLARVHKISSENSWLREKTNPKWVFSYDPTQADVLSTAS
jgi:6-hydroxynicotinate 3-monooxygenase